MSDERDPHLQALFAEAEQELPGDAFTGQVMARLRQQRRQMFVRRCFLAAVLLVGAYLSADLVGQLTHRLTVPLIDFAGVRGERWFAPVVSPLNSVAGVLTVALIAMRVFYRKLFRSL